MRALPPLRIHEHEHILGHEFNRECPTQRLTLAEPTIIEAQATEARP
ncbi:hypothetical protein DB31_5572 [Hyalangium minutum]|uniref:Uncharacterized protein n=1 Tax=Hyalangium minutum TaxID=394096 RepID=A0A085WS67_9BACT|nr:hypothetical protein DB31_5572 [Hyalangium minutum]